MTVRLERAPHLLARALAATVLVMTGATAAHTWAGGHVPGLPGQLTLGGVVLGSGLLFLRGTLDLRVLLPAVAVAQTGLHGMFGLLAPASAGHAGHATTGTDPVQWSWQMLVAHAVSTLLTVAVWLLCRRAAHVVITPLVVGSSCVGDRRTRRTDAPSRTIRPLLVHLVGVPRRGPPAVLRCA